MRFAPGQEIINILRGKIVDLDIMAKKKIGIERALHDIDTLILGSSHTQNAYLPHQNEFNLSMASQDLYYSYELLKKYDNPNIKNIVISFSVFSAGHQMIKTSQLNKSILYKLLFGINYQFPDYAKEKHLYERESVYKFVISRCLKKIKMDSDYRGEIERYFVSNKKMTEEYKKNYIAGNIKNNRRENEQIKYAEKIIKFVHQNGKNLFWLITPHSEEYRIQVPQKGLFDGLYDLCSDYNNVRILNFYDDNRFTDLDFLDIDHLNKRGAEKCTDIVRSYIKEINCAAA